MTFNQLMNAFDEATKVVPGCKWDRDWWDFKTSTSANDCYSVHFVASDQKVRLIGRDWATSMDAMVDEVIECCDPGQRMELAMIFIKHGWRGGAK